MVSVVTHVDVVTLNHLLLVSMCQFLCRVHLTMILSNIKGPDDHDLKPWPWLYQAIFSTS